MVIIDVAWKYIRRNTVKHEMGKPIRKWSNSLE